MHLVQVVTHWVIELILQLGYFGLFSGMVGQAVGVPLPSEAMLAFGGYLASANRLTFGLVILAGAGGDTFGAVVAYAIGYYGGRPVLVRFGRWFFIAQREIEAADAWFQRFGTRAVLICKLIPGVRAFGSYPAGVTRMSFWLFLAYTSLGAVIWALLFAGLGFHLGRNWHIISHYLRPISIGLIAALILGVAIWLFLHWRRGRMTT